VIFIDNFLKVRLQAWRMQVLNIIKHDREQRARKNGGTRLDNCVLN